jgi:hypothetical protein
MACSTRRKHHASFPSPMTCCFLSSLKTLLMPTEPIRPLVGVNVPGFIVGGFQVTIIGRFWVTAEDKQALDGSCPSVQTKSERQGQTVQKLRKGPKFLGGVLHSNLLSTLPSRGFDKGSVATFAPRTLLAPAVFLHYYLNDSGDTMCLGVLTPRIGLPSTRGPCRNIVLSNRDSPRVTAVVERSPQKGSSVAVPNTAWNLSQ